MNINDTTLMNVAKSLSVPVEWLWSLIQFESKWNPLARAGYPYNKTLVNEGKEAPKYARGLIQFIDSTAQGLGYDSADDLVTKNPDSKTQLLFPVLKYLEKFKPFPTEQSFYLSVFYPAARNWVSTKEFPQNVQDANPGIRTPKDYVNKVRGRLSTLKIPGGVAFLLFGAIMWIIIRRK